MAVVTVEEIKETIRQSPVVRNQLLAASNTTGRIREQSMDSITPFFSNNFGAEGPAYFQSVIDAFDQSLENALRVSKIENDIIATSRQEKLPFITKYNVTEAALVKAHSATTNKVEAALCALFGARAGLEGFDVSSES